MASHLVAQNAITTFTSPTAGTSPIDANTVRGNDNTIKTAYNLHDADGTIHFQDSTAAAKPAAGTAGRKWFTSDTFRIYYDNGVTWDEAAYALSAAGAFTAPVTITSTTANQLTILYDTSNKVTIDVSSAGAVTFNATGASAGFTFSDAITLSSTLDVTGTGTFSSSSNGTLSTISTRNTSVGNAAANRVSIGTDATAQAVVLIAYGSAHATKANNLEIVNTQNGTLILGTNNTANLTLAAAGGATFGGALAITGALSGVTTLAASGTVTLTATGTAIASSGAISVATNKKLGLNAGLTSYWIEPTSTTADFYLNGSRWLTFDTATSALFTNTNFSASGTIIGGSSISTADPTGGAGAWKLGIANAVSPTSPNRTITVDIGGTLYYIHAKTTNN